MLGKRSRKTIGRPRKYRRTGAKRTARMSRSVVSNSLVSIVRRYYVGQWTPTVSLGWNSTNYSFRLNNIPTYTEFTNLFEQYRINAVKLTFIPEWIGGLDQNNAYMSSTGGSPFISSPRLYTLIDKDGDPQTNTEDRMLENSKARLIKAPHRPFSIFVRKPCAQFEVATSLGFSGAAPKASPWLDCDNYGVNHFGCAIGAQVNGSATASMPYRIVATYYMQFKIAK